MAYFNRCLEDGIQNKLFSKIKIERQKVSWFEYRWRQLGKQTFPKCQPVLGVIHNVLTQLRPTIIRIPRLWFSEDLQKRYSDEEKQLILAVINNADTELFSRYEITKNRTKTLTDWRKKGGELKTLTDIYEIEGFTERISVKLFNSILEGGTDKELTSNGIKGQILHPKLGEAAVKKCNLVLAVYITVNSVVWSLVKRSNYEVLEWNYYNLDHREGKKMHITDILDSGWQITQKLPHADLYVMKAEPTTLRAAGSDPKNPKILSVNLQKSQLIAITAALLNVRKYGEHGSQFDVDTKNKLTQNVHYLRPNLPYRLFGTLVGNELVSTEQTIETVLRNQRHGNTSNPTVFVPDELRSKFRAQKGLERDMMGHCLLLAMTFMELCIYKSTSEPVKQTVKS